MYKLPKSRYITPGTYSGYITTRGKTSATVEDEWERRVSLVVQEPGNAVSKGLAEVSLGVPFDPNNLQSFLDRLKGLPSSIEYYAQTFTRASPEPLYSTRSNVTGLATEYISGAPDPTVLTTIIRCYVCRQRVKLRINVDWLKPTGYSLYTFFKEMLGPKGCPNCRGGNAGTAITSVKILY